MIGHSKHDFGGVTSFESVSKFRCDHCCSVIHGRGGGGSRSVGNLVRGGWFSLGGKCSGPLSVIPQSSEACIFKNIEAESPPHLPSSQIHQFGLSFCPLEMSPVSGRLDVHPAQLEEALCPVTGHSWAPGWCLLLPVVPGLSKVPGRETAEEVMGFTELGRTTARDWEWDQIISGECSGVYWLAGVCLSLSSESMNVSLKCQKRDERRGFSSLCLELLSSAGFKGPQRFRSLPTGG